MDEHPKISACIIAYNEAAVIDDCLASLQWVDEIVVVDSGSSDGTARLAEEKGCQVIHQDFLGYVKQKEFAIRQARFRWVLCLDADERLLPGGREVVEKALHDDGGAVAGYFLPRKTFYLGRWIEHGGWWPEYRLRLFDRERGSWVGTDPHDRVEVDGATCKLEAVISHFNYRDISHHLEKANSYTSIMADRKTSAGERASVAKMVFRPLGRFVRMYLLKQGFRDGVPGFIVAVIGAFYVFLKYAKLWELQRITTRQGEGRPQQSV